uniref:protein-serine/threonine phosphatase n=1 Tax=Aureoumbra lagunensis TaxID=44058 RepID=A0A7S3JZY9_9STRA|mmetsp:Transcript_13837/g.18482  ORF Transcript_13837/g.18482 Transcript_13837/m.18482 type:complete len:420 (-) Transcript_13837:86-1345(-)
MTEIIQGEKKRRIVVIQARTKFEGRELLLPGLSENDSIDDLKQMLEEATSIPRKRMRLIGLVKGRLPNDNLRLGALPINFAEMNEEDEEEQVGEIRFTLMGTPNEKLLQAPEIARKEIQSKESDQFVLEWFQRQENQKALSFAIKRTEINWITQSRPGFPLLVLDLDHTLVDFKSAHLDAVARRPYLDAFLASVYPFFDLVVWSQTSWRWIELKVTELGMLLNNAYKICFCIDKHSMLSVSSINKHGRNVDHRVKPLELIWRLYPQKWSALNTVHLDDLERNFVLNPRNGLRCRPFHRDHPRAANDNELALLSCYLTQHLANQPDFTKANISSWRNLAHSLYNQNKLTFAGPHAHAIASAPLQLPSAAHSSTSSSSSSGTPTTTEEKDTTATAAEEKKDNSNPELPPAKQPPPPPPSST